MGWSLGWVGSEYVNNCSSLPRPDMNQDAGRQGGGIPLLLCCDSLGVTYTYIFYKPKVIILLVYLGRTVVFLHATRDTCLLAENHKHCRLMS